MFGMILSIQKMRSAILSSMHAQPTTLQPASAGRVDRLPLRGAFRGRDRALFSSRGLARRLQLISTPAYSARAHLIFRSRFSECPLRAHYLRKSGRRIADAACFPWSSHRRHDHAALLFCQRLAQTIALPFSNPGDESPRRRTHRPAPCTLVKIGFIAMSVLRLCNAELLELGLTFPGVARRKQAIEALPSLGLLTLAGMTPPRIETQYLEVRDVNRDELPRDLDLVAISSLTATAKEAY